MKKLLLLNILFFPTFLLNGQTDFRPGYIIKNNGDSLLGQIDYRGDFSMNNTCRFKNINNEISKYLPTDIVAFRFIGSKYYVSKNVNNKTVFLEYLLKGIVSIYYMRDDQGDHYYIEKEGKQLVELPYEEKIKYVDNKQILYSTKTHIGLLIHYMQDAPEFQSRIANLGKPEHNNLMKLAEDYHKKVCNGEACIIYEKQLPFIKIDFEIAAGKISYNNSDFDKKAYIQGGVLLHIWMPRKNEKLYFRTGVLYSSLEKNSDHQGVYKIPFQLEYNYPKGIIRPKIAYGINIYKPFYQTVGLMAGINTKLHKSVFLSINYDADFNKNENIPIIPVSILSQSIQAGLLFKL